MDQGFRAWATKFAERVAGRFDADFLHKTVLSFQFLPEVIEKDRFQPETEMPIWTYLQKTCSSERVAQGQQLLTKFQTSLDEIVHAYGVPAQVLLAVWGCETAYGSNRGDFFVLDALASLAFEGRRAAFFEQQLIAALDILQAGDVSAKRFLGSWAGAMGHTQFMPCSYLQHAVDFDRDGFSDIWSDSPVDALASTAAYLQAQGWRAGQIWGAEVFLSPEAALDLPPPNTALNPSDWAMRGLTPYQDLPESGLAKLILPAGIQGPKFMVLENYTALLAYNPAQAYALSVCALGDAIAGGLGLVQPWPIGEAALSRNEKRNVQIALSALGYDTFGADGLMGPNTAAALWRYQRDQGYVADAYLSRALWAELAG